MEPKSLDMVKPVIAGKYGEDGILRIWKHFSGRNYRKTPWLCQSLKYPFLGATPDAYGWSDMASACGVVEVKLVTTCQVSSEGKLTSEYAQRAVDKWWPEAPPNYQLQHDTQMYVCGKSFGWIVAGFAFSNVCTFPRKARHDIYESDVIPALEDFARKARLT